jgi:ribose-phosphate pyrophosphokinase
MIKFMDKVVTPTRFPDGTTQVWKLDPVSGSDFDIDWRFEREDEIFTVAQLASLFGHGELVLYVPYLPFARQDKEVSNEATFALKPFADMLNALDLAEVIVFDVHNEEATHRLIRRLSNLRADTIHNNLIEKLKPDLVVFPDEGAQKRYPHLAKRPHVVFAKKRDQATGRIEGYSLCMDKGNPEQLVPGRRLLVVDDLCDGGATFLFLAKELNEKYKPASLDLFVTHGLFSKGRKPLEDAGYTLHTTNSLPRNPNGIPV